MPIIESAGNLLTPFSGFTQTFTNVVTFSYTGANQTWVVPAGIRKIRARCWGAGGGSGSTNGSPAGGGAGGYSYAEISVTPGSTLLIVAGQGGPAHSSGAYNTSIYGHATTPTGRPGGAGASCGNGGGLSGIFADNTFTQAKALLIAGAGGGGTSYVQNASTNQRGGGGGGANLAGGDADSQPDTYTAYGRGATTSAGGQSGAVFFKSSNGGGLSNDSINGGALYGGHASSFSSWTEGGGGGAGYWGGGPGNHDSAGGNWGNGGGGSGYANLTFCTNVVGASATKNVISATATADPYYASGIGTGNAGAAGGNGRVVLVY